MLQNHMNDLLKAKTPAGHPVLSQALSSCVKNLLAENQLYFNHWKVTILSTPREVALAMDALDKKARGESDPFFDDKYPVLDDLAPVSHYGICEEDDRYIEVQQMLYPPEPQSGRPYPIMELTLIPRVFIKAKLPALATRKKVVIEKPKEEKKVNKKK